MFFNIFDAIVTKNLSIILNDKDFFFNILIYI